MHRFRLRVNVPFVGHLRRRDASRSIHSGQRLDCRSVRIAHGIRQRAGDLHGSVGSVRAFRRYRIVHGGARSAGNRRRHDAPTLGGFITTCASWRWVFFLNVPFAIAALIAIAAWVPNQRDAARRPFDLRGFVLCGAALISLLYGTVHHIGDTGLCGCHGCAERSGQHAVERGAADDHRHGNRIRGPVPASVGEGILTSDSLNRPRGGRERLADWYRPAPSGRLYHPRGEGPRGGRHNAGTCTRNARHCIREAASVALRGIGSVCPCRRAPRRRRLAERQC